MNIGITGHQKLNDSSLWNWVNVEIDKILDQYSNGLVGVTSLAVGADQLFADAVLNRGGKLHVIVPFEGYELKYSRGTARENYFRLLHQAPQVDVLNKEESEEASYFAAGKKVANISALLIAVWNGKPAAGLGGTADVVKYAAQINKEVIHIDPTTKTVTKK